METGQINEHNYRAVKMQILVIKHQLERESAHNYDSMKSIERRQAEIKKEWLSFSEQMEKVGEFELESEYKFLAEIERNCTQCGKLYDKREGSEKLCPACFTSNA